MAKQFQSNSETKDFFMIGLGWHYPTKKKKAKTANMKQAKELV
jgi:hypothetical protein